MTRKLWCGCILFGLVAFATTVRADDPPKPQTAPPKLNVDQPPLPQSDQPVITPQSDQPAIIPQPDIVPPDAVLPPDVLVPETAPRVYGPYPYVYPGRFYYGYGDYYGYGYGGLGFNFGYGYRPLGYTFWPRYGDYMYFGRFIADQYRFYNRPYMWNPYWSYQRYRQYPLW